MKKHQKIVAYCYDKKGRLISKGQNSYTQTHPLQKHFAKLVNLDQKEFLHAEVSALLRARGKQVHKIHIERFTSNGKSALAKPCPICELAIKEFGVKIISYTI